MMGPHPRLERFRIKFQGVDHGRDSPKAGKSASNPPIWAQSLPRARCRSPQSRTQSLRCESGKQVPKVKADLNEQQRYEQVLSENRVRGLKVKAEFPLVKPLRGSMENRGQGLMRRGQSVSHGTSLPCGPWPPCDHTGRCFRPKFLLRRAAHKSPCEGASELQERWSPLCTCGGARASSANRAACHENFSPLLYWHGPCTHEKITSRVRIFQRLPCRPPLIR